MASPPSLEGGIILENQGETAVVFPLAMQRVSFPEI
jgi:hypothetical protein